MNILLINPSRLSPGNRAALPGGRHIRRWPPLSLLICAALLERQGCRVTLVDAQTRPFADAAEIIRKSAADADRIFISSSDIDRWQCPDLGFNFLLPYTELLNNTDFYVMGAHGTIYPETVLAATGARAVIIGEPETVVGALGEGKPLASVPGLAYWQGGRMKINPAPAPLALSALPPPAYHHLRGSDYCYELLGDDFALLETARGCPYHCSYCFKSMYGEGYREKPVGQTMLELEVIAAAGMKSLYFIDLNFTVNRERIMTLCREMAQRAFPLKWCCQTRPDLVDEELLAAMKKAGCRLIHYGIESGANERLRSLGKQITVEKAAEGIEITRKAGIQTAGFFLMGFAGESHQDIGRTIAFAKKLNMNYASLHIVSPYRQTGFYDTNYRGKDRFPESIHSGRALNELKKIKKKFLISYYLRPSFIFRNLFSENLLLTGKRLRLFLKLFHQP